MKIWPCSWCLTSYTVILLCADKYLDAPCGGWWPSAMSSGSILAVVVWSLRYSRHYVNKMRVELLKKSGKLWAVFSYKCLDGQFFNLQHSKQPQRASSKACDRGARGRLFHKTLTDRLSSVRERNMAVTSYYNQHSVDLASEKMSIHLTAATIMYSSETSDPEDDALRSTQRAAHQRGPSELPIRAAHQSCPSELLVLIRAAHQSCPSELPIRAAHQSCPPELPIRTAHQSCSSELPIRAANQSCPSELLTGLLGSGLQSGLQPHYTSCA